MAKSAKGEAAGRVAWLETHVGSERDAKALVDAVLGARLAACANWHPISSAYWWQGKLVREGEVRLAFTTAPSRLRALTATVLARHPYEVPYVSWGRALEVPAAYAAWAANETAGGQARPRPRRARALRRTR